MQSRPRRRTCGLPLRNSAPRTPLFRYANCYGCSNPASAASAKSIAPCRMHVQKNLRGGLRCATWGTPRIPTSLLLYRSAPPTPLRYRSSAKSIAVRKLHSPKKLHGGLRGAKWHSIPLHASNSASAAPRNQLHLRNCTRPKICVVGCGVLCGVGI